VKVRIAIGKDMLHEHVLVPGEEVGELLLNCRVHFVHTKPE
jgi:hypothetical protein